MYEPKIQTKTLQNEVMIETGLFQNPGFFFFKKSTMYKSLLNHAIFKLNVKKIRNAKNQ